MSETPDAGADPRPEWGEARSRIVTWWDPMTIAAGMAGRDGLSFLQAVAAGELPPAPIGRLMGFSGIAVGPGTATFTCTPDESTYNPIGVVHGGLVCTLLDSALACAVQTTLPAGQAYTSIDLNVSYLRAVTRDSGELTCVGTVTKPGRRVAFAEGTVHDGAGRLVATATSSLLVFAVPTGG